MKKTIEKVINTEKLVEMAQEVIEEMRPFPRPISGMQQRTEDAVDTVMALKKSGKLTPEYLKLAFAISGCMDGSLDGVYDFWNNETTASIAIDAVNGRYGVKGIRKTEFAELESAVIEQMQSLVRDFEEAGEEYGWYLGTEEQERRRILSNLETIVDGGEPEGFQHGYDLPMLIIGKTNGADVKNWSKLSKAQTEWINEAALRMEVKKIVFRSEE